MQRVALCRALLMRPRLLLADEPTGNLDDENGTIVLDLLLALARESSAALLIATHSQEVAERADAVWKLKSGSLERP
jgi:ABC-type lipoprotein export system ATPase subunit